MSRSKLLSPDEWSQIRLTRHEIVAIPSVMEQHLSELGDASLWLFGSRSDPKKRGGDIDLFLEVSQCVDNLDLLRR
jgi:hypothetical protein